MKVVAGASLPDLRALMVASDLGGTALARLLLGYGAATDATVVSCGIRRFLAMQFFSLKSSPPPPVRPIPILLWPSSSRGWRVALFRMFLAC